MEQMQARLNEERFRMEDKRITKLEDSCGRLTELSIQMGEILKRQDIELSDHKKRLDRIEHRPLKQSDALRAAAAAALVSAAVSYLFRFL